MAKFSYLFVFLCFCLNIGIVDVPEHGLSHFSTLPVTSETRRYFFDFDHPEPTMFVYVWIRSDCQTELHLFQVLSMEPTVLSLSRSNITSDAYYREKYYRVMVLEQKDCMFITHCYFAISYKGVSNTTDCVIDFRLDRGLKLSLNQKYSIASGVYNMSDPTHFEIHNHLYMIQPKAADLPVLLAVDNGGDYAVTLTHSWGISSSVYVSFNRGSFRVIIPLQGSHAEIPMLFVWIDIVNGPAYTVRFEPGSKEPYPLMWMYIAFGVLTSLFVLSCGFVLLGFRHNRLDNDEVSIIHEDVAPDMATSEDLRMLDLITWNDKRNCKNLECCICLDEFEKGAVVRILPCMHGFHQTCIDTWLLSRQRKCPLCNQDILDAHNFHRSSTSRQQSIELGVLGKNVRTSSRMSSGDSVDKYGFFEDASDTDVATLSYGSRESSIGRRSFNFTLKPTE